LGKFVVFKNVDDMPETAVSRSSMSWNKTGSWRSSTPVRKDLRPPCNHSCPAGENIRGYIDLIKKNKVRDAFDLLTEANPLPAVCGRVCYHPCQSNCNRKDFDTELQVRLMEKFIGDWGIDEKISPELPKLSSKKAAIIGAGPAGIAAAHYLRLKGINVTIYDDGSILGGILQYGIPSYRLDKEILRLELDRVLSGIELKLNSRFGSDFDIGDLIDYDSIFLATGAHRSRSLGIDGESLDGVEPGLAFLRNVNEGKSYDLRGRKVIVVGGGNTACDVARSAYRLGAQVALVYRRTEKEMPAFSEEIEQLKSEPIKTEFLAAPVRVERTDDGKLKVLLIRMKLGEPDESGRARPTPIKGSEFELTADRVFSAIGEDPDLSFFPVTSKDNEGYFDFSGVDKRIRDKLFIGGDILPNPRTVPHAVGSGRLAAERIISMFEGKNYDPPEEIAEVAGPEDINYIYFTRINAAKWSERINSGGRISDVETAVEEANRCFSCGVCYECDNCFNFCPDMSVVRSADGYHVNLDYCKGCGICAQECPCGSLKMEGGR
jgi:NADPH-dependent glutamate synthase beta subunit-like oxidoreductase